MDFSTLEMNSILLAPTHLHMQIRKQMVQESKGMMGIKILSISQFLSTYIHEEIQSMPRALLHVQKKLKPMYDQFTTYKSIVLTPLFLKECYQFINDIRMWNKTDDDLPKQNDAQQELDTILQCFSTIQVPADLRRSAIAQLEHQDVSNVYIVDAYTTIEDQQIISILCKQGAHMVARKRVVESKEFYHAVNKRAEIEACAQYIVTHQIRAEDIHITLCDASYQQVLQQVFSRYKIPFTILQSQRSSLLPNRFLSLFDVFVQRDTTHVLACLDTGLCKRKGLAALREYIQLFHHDFFAPFTHVRSITDSGHVLDEKTLTSLQTLEEQADAVARELRPIFEQLLQITHIDTLFEVVSSLVKESLSKPEDTYMYTRIVSLLEDVHDEIQDSDDFDFLRVFIEELSINESPTHMQGILVHTLTQDILDREHHFMLGATQTKYPAFSTKKGVFDERYYAQVAQYPSMQTRYEHYVEELNTLLHTAKHIYISYPLGTYEGKGMESALEIEQFMGIKPSAYPLHKNYVAILREDTISPQTAKRLFVSDQVMKGSISSIERYVKCPFSYFLRYGLSLQEPMKPGFPDSYAGTLMHYILETLTSLYGKEYTQHAQDSISHILDEELQKLQAIFPAMQGVLDNVKQRIEVAMHQTMTILEEFESHSSLTPSQFEKAFQYTIPIEDDITLCMRGYIDRIDETSAFSCILDYKSSMKTLSQTNVFAALQLQLLTYAMVLEKENGKEVLGAFYVSLKNENIPYTAGRMSRRKPVTHVINDKEHMEEERKKAHRFNGWAMSYQMDALDDDGRHFVGLSQSRDGIVKARKVYHLPSITNHFTTMYQMLCKRMLSGDIACKPMEDACTYCVYHEICRFHGFYEEKKQLIEVGDEIYQNGESEDA